MTMDLRCLAGSSGLTSILWIAPGTEGGHSKKRGRLSRRMLGEQGSGPPSRPSWFKVIAFAAPFSWLSQGQRMLRSGKHASHPAGFGKVVQYLRHPRGRQHQQEAA